MRAFRMRSIASVVVMSFLAGSVGATEITPAHPSLWQAAQNAGARVSVKAQTGAGPATGNPRTDSSFFKTTAGRITLGLMVVGVGLTIYSVNHDRKPVKSPIR